MNPDQVPSSPLASVSAIKHWKLILLRAAAFGGGFAIIAALLSGTAAWWLHQPKEWSDRSITAKPTVLMVHRDGEEERLEFRYVFTNNSNTEYILPSLNMGSLMRKLPGDNSLEKLAATWDNTTKIPPQQSIGVAFSVTYQLSEYGTSASELESNTKESEFVGRRLEDIDGLVFFDYTSKYRIVMPKNWDVPKH